MDPNVNSNQNEMNAARSGAADAAYNKEQTASSRSARVQSGNAAGQIRFPASKRRIIRVSRLIAIGLVALMMGIGSVTGLVWFARPDQSQIENRMLTPFPAISWSGFWDGSWFSDISVWYADTFPGRESLVASANSFKNLYGIQTNTQMFGGKTASQVDAIPTDDESGTQNNGDDVQELDYTQIELPANFNVEEEVQNKILEGSLVIDGAAYSIYYYVNEAAQAYISMINKAAKELEGETQIYVALAPTNAGVTLDDEVAKGTGGSNQVEATHYYYSHFNDLVIPVDTIDNMRLHKDEYLYFNTDHHWTALGAYYVYESLCEAKGWDPIPLEEFESKSYSPFYGSLRDLPAELNPDTLTGYIPKSTNTSKIFLSDGQYVPLDAANEQFYEGEVFSTNENIDEYNQYMRFINGDNGLVEITNPTLEEGDSCVVIKESYGNALVPFLVDQYKTIYVIDWRYAEGSIVDFCRENQIDDLIFANSLQLIGSPHVVASIAQMMIPASRVGGADMAIPWDQPVSKEEQAAKEAAEQAAAEGSGDSGETSEENPNPEGNAEGTAEGETEAQAEA